VIALPPCLCHYGHLFNGLTNRSLRELIAEIIPGYTAAQATYDLRRVGIVLAQSGSDRAPSLPARSSSYGVVTPASSLTPPLVRER
jgi:hypothetical protein